MSALTSGRLSGLLRQMVVCWQRNERSLLPDKLAKLIVCRQDAAHSVPNREEKQ